MSARVVEIVEYQESWPAIFETEKQSIERLLSKLKLKIHHIGSTSVKGLAAKSIIDILIECPQLSEIDLSQHAFKELGYVVLGENGISGRRYFQKGGDRRSHHIHIFEQGDDHIFRHLAFRDYLRAHPSVANEYQQVKQTAADTCSNDSVVYGQLKNDFILEHEKLAINWVRKT